MPTLYIEYYNNTVEGGKSQVADKLLGNDKLAIGGSSVRTSSDIPDGTDFIVLKTDTACQYALGTSSVTATATSQFLPANAIWPQGTAGNARIAVIQQQ